MTEISERTREQRNAKALAEHRRLCAMRGVPTNPVLERAFGPIGGDPCELLRAMNATSLGIYKANNPAPMSGTMKHIGPINYTVKTPADPIFRALNRGPQKIGLFTL